jgi:Uncharacterized protein conserved in bacteria
MNKANTTVDEDNVKQATRKWLESIVIELNLCPFAKKEYLKERVRFSVSMVESREQLLQDLVIELALLNKQPEIETTLLITPVNLTDFDTYNQFLNFSDALLRQMKLEGVFQIAGFHPDYRFAGSQATDVENYTNRSPYPMLHILREASVQAAIDAHPNTEQIPQDNIQQMRTLGLSDMKKRLRDCQI